MVVGQRRSGGSEHCGHCYRSKHSRCSLKGQEYNCTRPNEIFHRRPYAITTSLDPLAFLFTDVSVVANSGTNPQILS